MLPPIISSQELSELISHKHCNEKSKNDLIVFDCRFSLTDDDSGRDSYLKNHIPTAIHLDLNRHLSDPELEHGGRHPLPRQSRFTALMQASGVCKQSHIVIYDDHQFGFAARLWWLLRYFGHEHVQLLDGGYQGWIDQGGVITSEIIRTQPGNFAASPHPHWIVDHPSIEHSLNSPTRILIDSREPSRYLGLQEPIDPVAGHIPGAANYPWQEITDDQGYLLPPAQQQQRWLSLPKEKEIVVYCGSGVTACVNLLSLEVAGITGARLYPGGWSDWCSFL